MSWIEVIIGPMFSGKTTELLRRGRRYALSGYKCLYLKWKKDERYDANKVVTHDQLGVEALSVESISSILDNQSLKCFDVLLVDEGQFISDLHLVTKSHFKVCVVAGLDADFNMNPFKSMVNLIPKANKVDKLSAICECKKEAHFTKLIANIPVVGNILIGGSNEFKATCRECYYK